MPYKIVQHGNKFSAVSQNAGHVAGTEPTRPTTAALILTANQVG